MAQHLPVRSGVQFLVPKYKTNKKQKKKVAKQKISSKKLHDDPSNTSMEDRLKAEEAEEESGPGTRATFTNVGG